MVRKVMEGSHAIADALKLCKPEVIPAYPITSQTHIVEKLSELVADGEIDAEYLNVDSEHSAMATCIGAQATGVRTFTATCGQGLALMWELLYAASGMRLPIVMAVTNRALSSPLNIWCDWSDAIGARDSGWLQFYCKNAQEAYDTIIQAYRIAEEVSLPAMVCIDGFFVSHTLEPVETIERFDNFVDAYKPKLTLDTAKPMTQGTYAMPEDYQEFKEIQDRAMNDSKDVIKKINDEFGKKFGRTYGDGLIETYNMANAKYAIITMGSVAGTIKHVIDRRAEDIGLVRIKAFRPFPCEELKEIVKNVESIGVFEKDISYGSGGALTTEVRSLITKPIASFIGGLGGRDVTVDDVNMMFEKIKRKETGTEWIGSKLNE